MTPGDYKREIKIGGVKRAYQLHIPKNYDGRRAVPLVLIFHGGGGNPWGMRYQADFDPIADREGFITIYPYGMNGVFTEKLLTWNTGICCGYSKEHKIDDVHYVDMLLDDVEKVLAVDTKRIYATGLSNGALMSYRLAAELSERIAAIAPVSAQVERKEFAVATRRVPIMHFHGLYDRNAPYAGGVGANSVSDTDFVPLIPALRSWAVANGCSPTMVDGKVIGEAAFSSFQGCPKNADVSLWTLRDGGHTWPRGRLTIWEIRLGLGKVNKDISASEEMWRFFKAHSLP